MSRYNAEGDVGFESEGLGHGRFLNFKFQNSTFKCIGNAGSDFFTTEAQRKKEDTESHNPN
jgi:hypothetical protein